MAIEAGDFKTGLTLIVDGDPWQVIDFQRKTGQGCSDPEDKDEKPQDRCNTGKKLQCERQI